jgi:ubiquinone/menaquinone biosynthesis C-methylase UbiE
MFKQGITGPHGYMGLDTSEEMIGLARGRFPSVAFEHQDGLDIPWPDHWQDTVINVNVLQHLEDYRPMLAELTRVTDKVLYIVTWLGAADWLVFDGRFHQNVFGMSDFLASVLAARGGVKELRLRHLWQQCYSVTVRYE